MSTTSKDPKLTEEEKSRLPVLKLMDQVSEVRLSGVARKTDGTLARHKYFDFVTQGLDDYTDITFTPEEATKVRKHLQTLKTGAAAMTPMICKASQCFVADRCVLQQMGKAPLGRACHPPGTLINTTNYGQVSIEKLDPSIHKLIVYERKRNGIRHFLPQEPGKYLGQGRWTRENCGVAFELGQRNYDGILTKIITDTGESYEATHDHICIAKFNEHAVGKKCVYLMKKGNFWRIGQTYLVREYKKSQRGHKTHLSVLNRAAREGADALWILGVFDNIVDTFFAEERFALWFQISKVVFNASRSQKTKWQGFSKWATQEQIDNHHKQLTKDESYFRQKLSELGLSIDYPIWTKDHADLVLGDEKLYVNWPMYIRASNLLSDVMDVPVIGEESKKLTQVGAHKYRLAEWRPIKVERRAYSGIVYSLEVEKYKTYFANNIATHNCLLEINLLQEWRLAYLEEYEVDLNSFTEIGMVSELAEIEVLNWRLSINLAKAENAELVQDNVIGIDPEGNPILQKQVSQFLEARERLMNRKSKLIKLMVGDRQEKYKREAALKIREEKDPSQSMASLRARLEAVQRELDKRAADMMKKSGIIEASYAEKPLTPEDILKDEE